MSILPLAKMEGVIREAPENLIFASTENLIAVVKDTTERYAADCKIECVAELMARWYLKPENELEQCFDSFFPRQEWHSLKKIKEHEIFSVPTASGLPAKLWESSDPVIRNCEVTVRRKLSNLLNADGFIPVYSGEEAFFLPFSLEEYDPQNLICDTAKTPIENWQEPYQALPADTPEYSCIVHCRQAKYLPSLVGHSLMLPLYLAALRKSGVLPPYNIFRLLSTGAIEHGHLKAVETKEKQKALDFCFADSYLFFPESSQRHSEDKNAIPLNITLNLKELQEEMRKQIEAKGLVIPTFREAKGRLKSLDSEIRHDNQSRWKTTLARLQTNMDAIQLSRDREPEAYLLCLMLKSSIYCHMGNTDQALQFNKKAKEEAKRLGLEKHLRRLEIEELVDLQDIEDFSSISSLAGQLKEDIERLQDDDLLMRYYGTMGQAHCYGYLAGFSGFDRDTAKSYFSQALLHAYKTDSERDIAQDLNYNYLWYVLFDPGTEEAAHAYTGASDHIERNLREYPESQKNNRYFLQRFKMQALFRRLLTGEQIPPVDYEKESLPAEAYPWLQALVKKYLGAIAAANGDNELARTCFQTAGFLLERDCGNKIIAFIRMTVYAEAFRSLHHEDDRLSALKILEGIPEFPTITQWKAYLEHPEREEYPALHYWY